MSHTLAMDAHGPQLAWYARPGTPRGRWNAEDFGAFRTEAPMAHEEALALARGDWTVSGRPMFTVAKDAAVADRPNGQKTGSRAVPVPRRIVLVRDSDETPLGMAFQSYGIAQNLDVLGRVFSRLTGETHTVTAPDGTTHDEPTREPVPLDSLAVLGDDGARLYAQAYLGRLDILARGGVDTIDTYLSAMWGHDGRTNVRAGLSMTRAVCENTMGMSLIEAGKHGFKVRHTSGIKSALRGVGDALSAAVSAAKERAEAYSRLASVTFTNDQAADVAKAAFESESKRAREARDAVVALFDGTAHGFDLAGRTAWGAINAVTQYVDRSWNRSDEDTRIGRMLASELSESADEIRDRAMTRTLQLVGA